MIAKNNLKINPNKANLNDIKSAQKIIGKLLYLVLETKQDIAFSILKLTKYTSNPNKEYLITIKRIFRYLKSIKNFKTIYKKDYNSFIKGFCNFNYTNNKNSTKFISGYIFIYGNSLIN